jgi:hypothetical protein
MIVLRFSIQGEDIFELINGKCHAFYILVCKGRILLSGKCHVFKF